MPPGNSNSSAIATSSTGFAQQPLFHRVPASPPEGSSKKETSSDKAKPNCERQPEEGPTVHHDNSNVKSSNSEIANVLLLAAAASQESRVPVQEEASGEDDSSHGAETVETSSAGPLKKRKTVVDILRKKPDDQQGGSTADPFHVSPMSQGSKTAASNETTLNRTSRALSYESKEETKTTKTSSTVTSNSNSPKSATQFPPTQSLVPYFPSALHWLLTESSSQNAVPEYAAARSVIQWVPHGQAFRVVRWDALRKQVLPQFFPQLAGSVDAFMWHLAAWGFEEIQDGPDVGAFGHTVSH